MDFLVLTGKVLHGRQVGKKIGFPTINIKVPRNISKNKWGIYFSLIRVAQKFYPAVTHLGPIKTFALIRPACESHLLTLKKDFYGRKVEVIFLLKFREVKKFSDLEKLKQQIKNDVKAAKKFFGLSKK